MDDNPGFAASLAEALQHRYRIERELGRGGMAVVYLAQDLKHGRPVALKVLDPRVGEALGAERFLREIEIAAGLTHPRIVPLLDSGSSAGLLYYVMPYVEGESLRQRLDRERQLPLEDAVEIARQVAGALAHAHDRGIVHRDVKPENILLSGPEAVVADFGIARALTVAGDETLTQAGFVMGTPAYMSPEQASGEGDPDARSDVYSLACVLYEMLAGEPPFTGPTAQAVTARKLTEPAPDVTRRRDSVPAPLAAVVRRGLARLPADRYRSAGELNEALRRAGEGTRSASAATTAAHPRARFGWRAAAVGAAAGVLLAGAALLSGWLDRGRGPAFGTVVQLPIDGLGELGAPMALSPDGRRLAYVSGDRLWVRDLGDLESRAVPGGEGARLPFWSPDGAEVGYVARGRLWRAPVAGGEGLPITAPGVGFAGGSGVTWTGDGAIVFATGSTALMTVPVRGGMPRALVPLDPGEEDHHHPHALPGGRGILFVPHRRAEGFDQLVILADGERRPLLRLEGQQIEHPVYSRTGHILFTASGGIWAVPFSLRRLDVTGEPFLVRTGVLAPSAAADAVLAFFRGPGAPARQLAFVDREGELDRTVGEPGRFEYFSISPSGREVAVAGGDPWAIWIVDPLSGTRRRPTSEGEGGNFPRWSPDGDRIAYLSLAPGGEPGVRIRAADGTGAARDVARAWYPSFTPDGEAVVLTLGMPSPDEGWHVGYVRLDRGGDPVPIVATAAWECCQHVSPDGRYMAYASDVSGRWDVYVTRFPSGEGTWLVSTAGGSWPRWDARGGRLYYAQDSDLMEVRVSTEAGLELGRPQRLFSRPGRVMDIRYGKPDYYDVTPDGERFLVVLPAAADELVGSSIVVVGDWRQALER